VLNLAMPRRDGLEAIPLLRSVDGAPAILVFSGYDGEQMAEPTRSLGGPPYVQKGGRAAEIREIIRTLAADLRASS
jgi:DNA-binding NarL/FixJ family response regulator